MVATPKRGAVAPPQSGVYKDPSSDGVKENTGSGAYRPPVDGVKDISEINYIPYGGVYERETDGRVQPSPSGGVFEVYKEEAPKESYSFLVSLTYPPLINDYITSSSLITGGSLYLPTEDSSYIFSTIDSGTLNTLLQEYLNWPAEEVYLYNCSITGGSLATVLLQYDWPEESAFVTGAIDSGDLVTVVINYSNWPEENAYITGTITGGTLV